MQYIASILAGVSASAMFWIMAKYLLNLPDSDQMIGFIGVF